MEVGRFAHRERSKTTNERPNAKLPSVTFLFFPFLFFSFLLFSLLFFRLSVRFVVRRCRRLANQNDDDDDDTNRSRINQTCNPNNKCQLNNRKLALRSFSLRPELISMGEPAERVIRLDVCSVFFAAVPANSFDPPRAEGRPMRFCCGRTRSRMEINCDARRRME